MNKTVSINIGGIVFHIDETAYEKLGSYLSAIRGHFDGDESKDEIIADIEGRIAEMFQEKIVESKREVVLMADVEEIMSVMGKPEDFGDVEADETSSSSSSRAKSETRRFYRNPDDKVFGGVLSGISYYFGIDPLWLRLAFVLGFFIWGTGLLIYIILWIIIPEAKSAAEKLEMKGEQVNVGNIEKTVKEEIDTLKRKLDDLGGDKTKVGSAFERFIDFVVTGIKYLFKFVVKALGLALAVGAVGFLIAMSLALLSSIGVISVFPLPYPIIFSSNAQMVIGLIGLVLLVGIPLIALCYLGLQIIFNFKVKVRNVGFALGGLWLIGLLSTSIIAAQVGSDFSERGNTRTTTELLDVTSDTLYLDVLGDYDREEYGDVMIDLGDDRSVITHHGERVGITSIWLDVRRGDEDYFEIVETRSARGSSRKEATASASNIEYEMVRKDSLVKFSPLLHYGEQHMWRNQRVEIVVKVPVGNTVYLAPGLQGIIYDIDNVTNTHDRYMTGHKWLMTQDGLACVDCDRDPEMPSIEIMSYQELDFFEEGDEFDRIEVEGSFQVMVKQGDAPRMRYAGSVNNMRRVDMEVRGSTLRIKMEQSIWKWRDRNRHAGQLEITVPSLEKLEISGATDARVKGFDADEFELDVSGMSNARVDGTFDILNLEVSGNSSASMIGEANVFNAEVTGASKLRSTRLMADMVNLKLAGFCKAEVYANDILNVEADGACEVKYKGDPQLQSDVTGASSISKW